MTSSARSVRSPVALLVVLVALPLLACHAARAVPASEPYPSAPLPPEPDRALVQEEAPSTVAGATDAAAPAPQAAAGEQAVQDVASHFSTREPIYLAVGFHGRTNAKFQISFKYRLIDPEGPLARESEVWEELYLGFVTTTLWNLEAESTPFFDTTYRPSLFWLRERIEAWSSERLDFGAEVGVEHESNGKGGDDSRSLNVVYVKPIWKLSRCRRRPRGIR